MNYCSRLRSSLVKINDVVLYRVPVSCRDLVHAKCVPLIVLYSCVLVMMMFFLCGTSTCIGNSNDFNNLRPPISRLGNVKKKIRPCIINQASSSVHLSNPAVVSSHFSRWRILHSLMIFAFGFIVCNLSRYHS